MKHPVVKRDAWLQDRMTLLRREKAATRELDAIARERQNLPWVAIEKDYTLATSRGETPLPDLFEGHSQLIVYHFMYGREWEVPCDGCSAWADAFNGTIGQIEHHDATLIAVSDAPIDKLTKTAQQRGWTFEWASSARSDFNRDFHMTADADTKSKTIGDEVISYDRGQSGGINVFVRSEGCIYHSYSAFNRGILQMNGAYGFVDLLPFGGN